jgi:hypothetical protein
MGATFDPAFLDRANIRGVSGNEQEALSWYRHARDLGEAGVERLLKTFKTQTQWYALDRSFHWDGRPSRQWRAWEGDIVRLVPAQRSLERECPCTPPGRKRLKPIQSRFPAGLSNHRRVDAYLERPDESSEQGAGP